MGARTLRLNEKSENMLEVLWLMQLEKNKNELIASLINSEYQEKIESSMEDFRQGWPEFLKHTLNCTQEEYLNVAMKALNAAESSARLKSTHTVIELKNIKTNTEEYMKLLQKYQIEEKETVDLCDLQTIERSIENDDILKIHYILKNTNLHIYYAAQFVVLISSFCNDPRSLGSICAYKYINK